MNPKFLYLIVTIMFILNCSCKGFVTTSTDAVTNQDTVIKCHIIREGEMITEKLYYLFDKKNDRLSKLSCYLYYENGQAWSIRFSVDDKEILLLNNSNKDSAVLSLPIHHQTGFKLSYQEQILWAYRIFEQCSQENDLTTISFADTFLSGWGDGCLSVSRKYSEIKSTIDYKSLNNFVLQSQLVEDFLAMFSRNGLQVKSVESDGIYEISHELVSYNSTITEPKDSFPKHFFETRIHFSFR